MGRPVDELEAAFLEPGSRRLAVLAPGAADLLDVGEVAVELEAERRGQPDHAPVGQGDVLIHARPDAGCDPDFDRILGQLRAVGVAAGLLCEKRRQSPIRPKVAGRDEGEVVPVDRETSTGEDASVVVVQPLGVVRDRAVGAAAQDRVIGVEKAT